MDRAIGFVESQDVGGHHEARADDRRAGTVDTQAGHAAEGQHYIGRKENERRCQGYLARSYCTGQCAAAPSAFSARRAKYGSRSIWRARNTRSAAPEVTISFAWSGSVIKPTAPVGISAC